MAARIGSALGALLVIAALAVELRAHDLIANAAQTAARPKPQAAAVDRRLHDLKLVNDLRPGSQGSLAAAALDFRLARYAAAARAAGEATRREPENFSAWVTLAVARGAIGDGAGRRAAFARAHALNPLYPIPR